jgi:hypothetical protein
MNLYFGSKTDMMTMCLVGSAIITIVMTQSYMQVSRTLEDGLPKDYEVC